MPQKCPADSLNVEQALSPTGCPISPEAAAFNPFEGPYQVDPAAALQWARDQEPVFYAPELGYWVVTRYDDVKAVFRDHLLFSPANALEKITPAPPKVTEILNSYGFNMQRTMVNEDEPDHMERRRLLMDDFLPEKLAKHEPAVRALTRQYMDKFIDRGEADLVKDIFYEIPLTVALHFLGVPDEGADELKKYIAANTLNTWGKPTEEQQLEVAETVGKFWQTANRILDEMWADPTGEGWMYETIRQHEKHPEIVPESYMRSMMMAILAAAHETTSNATANAFLTLLSNREAWEDLCENPALIPSAAEECLRVGGSIIAWRRVATAECDVGGVKIPEGGKLLLVQISANKDARHWENPDLVDIYRDNAVDHLSFGYGAHQCMGKNIARMEMRVFLEEFTKRLPHLQLVEGQAFDYLPNTSFRGPEKLLVEWDPALNPERSEPSILDRSMSFRIGAPVRDDILRQVVVADVIAEAEGALRIELADPRGRALPKWTPGAHIDLVSGGFRRKYSLCGDQVDTSRYCVTILREAEGRGGSLHFHGLKPGDVLHIAGPKNHFKLDEEAGAGEKAGAYVLIAGGIGITPIIAMADWLKARGARYELHYCGSSRDRMALLDRADRDHGAALHIKAEGSRLELSGLSLADGAQVYACGPERLLAALDEMGWPEGVLHTEHFTAGSSVLDPENEQAFEAVLKDSDLTVTVARDQTLLEALTAAGVDVPCDCAEGLCGTCEVEVLEGEVDHRDKVLSNAGREAGGRMMACCSRAGGKRVVLRL